MKKFKIFLIGFSLIVCSNFAFAMEKESNYKNIENLKEQSSIIQIPEQENSITSKNIIDKLKYFLIKNNFLNYNESFFQFENNQLQRLPYEDFLKDAEKSLKEQMENMLKENKKIDYSKIKIKLPENIILNAKKPFLVSSATIKFTKLENPNEYSIYVKNEIDNKENKNFINYVKKEELNNKLEQINLKHSVKNYLKDSGFLTDEEEFLQFENNQLQRLPYEDFLKDAEKSLKEQMENMLKENKKIDYSKIEIKLPENIILSEENRPILKKDSETGIFKKVDFNPEKDIIFAESATLKSRDKNTFIIEPKVKINDEKFKEFKNLIKKYFEDRDKIKKYIKKINTEERLKNLLKDNGFLTKKENLLQFENNTIKNKPYEDLKKDVEKSLKKQIQDMLKENKKIDYSKIEVKLPENFVFKNQSNDKSVANSVIFKFEERGRNPKNKKKQYAPYIKVDQDKKKSKFLSTLLKEKFNEKEKKDPKK